MPERAVALKTAGIESGAAVGFIGAVGAFGGYLIPTGFGESIARPAGRSSRSRFYPCFLRFLPRADMVVLPASQPAG